MPSKCRKRLGKSPAALRIYLNSSPLQSKAGGKDWVPALDVESQDNENEENGGKKARTDVVHKVMLLLQSPTRWMEDVAP